MVKVLGKMKKKLLIINKYFYPGYKAGGPIQSLKNICDALQCEFEISVLTQDRDFLDTDRYKNIISGVWTAVGGYKVFYEKGDGISNSTIKRVVEETSPDLIYLSSFFDKISICAAKLARKNSIPVVLAPRGEFSPGALKIRKLKKTVFLKFAAIIGLYRGVTYHSTSRIESGDIRRIMGRVPFFVSENLVKKPLDNIVLKPRSHELRLAYISRVTSKKNLLFFLQFLNKLIFDKKIMFDIYGPIDDSQYWDECLNAISTIDRKRIKVNYMGPVSPDRFIEIYGKTHFSVLPTHGENFGHSIYESLAHGVPVIIGDQTPWRDLEGRSAGFDVNVSATEFNEIFYKLGVMNDREYEKYSRGALSLAHDYYRTLDIKGLIENFNRLALTKRVQ